MSTKILVPALGILLLGGSVLAQADGRDHHDRAVSQYHSWHDDAWRGNSRREWRDHYQPHYRWSRPAERSYWSPPPGWHHHYYAHPGYRFEPWTDDRDGLTVILRGRLN